MSRPPVVLLHGYSDRGKSCERWRKLLTTRGGYADDEVHVVDYVSLSDEITLKDLAEGFERALRAHDVLRTRSEFDAIVHSTGGLVIRQWLASYGAGARRVKRLIGLAPAMFGSPLAHKGRSLIGALAKGNRELGPDFGEAGDRVLSGLELGSAFTWDLAHKDLVGPEHVYGEDSDTPYPFVLIGADGYSDPLRRLISDDGTDGTVRWAGASLTTRKLVIDLTRDLVAGVGQQFAAPVRSSVNVPFALVPEQNHSSILREPSERTQQMVLHALQVEDLARYRAWDEQHGWSPPPAAPATAAPAAGGGRSPLRWLRRLVAGDDACDLWQQFVVRALDERGDPVPDWYMELGSGDGDAFRPLERFSLDVHPFKDDPSYRCFHVNLTKLAAQQPEALVLRLTARTGTRLVAYHGAGSERFVPGVEADELAAPDTSRIWDARIALPAVAPEIVAGDGAHETGAEVRFFYPYTTTLVEVWLNREPMPASGVNDVLRFLVGTP